MNIGFNVKLGIVAGLLNCLAWYIGFRTMNIYSYEVDVARWLSGLALLLIGAFICVYMQRKSNGGYIEFKEALRTSFLFVLVTSLIVAIFSVIYYRVLAPDVIEYFRSDAKKAMAAQHMSESDMVKELEVIDSYFGFFRMLMSNVIFGVIFSLLAAAVLRRKNPIAPFSAN